MTKIRKSLINKLVALKPPCIFDDKYNSINENRELIIGYSNLNNLLVVSFTEREKDLIRIISCRKATTRERKNHEQYRS